MPLLYDYGVKLFREQLNVEDAVHDFFIHLSQRNRRLQVPVSVRAYLLTAFRNFSLKQLRRNSRMLVQDLDAQHFELSFLYTEAADAVISHREAFTQVNQAIAGLPPRQKEIIYLKFFHELSNTEIAAVMKIEPSSVYKLFYKAMDGLRAKLDKLPVAVLLVLLQGMGK
ncbi:hypothetical protein HBIMPC_04980 [Chitinophaga sp. 212800010-3]|nr:hypothetical protein [Chitinophaga sp. 212800010-3]